MKRWLLSVLAAAGLATVPGAALAGCVEFETVAAPTPRYDPFSPAPTVQALGLRLRRTAPEVTSVRFLIADPTPDRAASRLGAAGPRDYALVWLGDASRRVFVSGAEQPNGTNGALVAFGAGPAGDVVHTHVQLRVPAGQPVTAGRHEEPLEIRYVCYAGAERIGGGETQRTNQVAVAMETPEQISVHVGSLGQRRGEIALGVLDTGADAWGAVAIIAQSTSAYEISVAARWGELRRGEADAARLPYALSLDGAAVEPGARIGCGPTPAPAGRTHQLQAAVRGRDADVVPAGSYSDVLTITFSPRLGLSGPSACSI